MLMNLKFIWFVNSRHDFFIKSHLAVLPRFSFTFACLLCQHCFYRLELIITENNLEIKSEFFFFGKAKSFSHYVNKSGGVRCFPCFPRSKFAKKSEWKYKTVCTFEVDTYLLHTAPINLLSIVKTFSNLKNDPNLIFLSEFLENELFFFWMFDVKVYKPWSIECLIWII